MQIPQWMKTALDWLDLNLLKITKTEVHENVLRIMLIHCKISHRNLVESTNVVFDFI